MRQSRTVPYRNVRPGRALRPAAQPRSSSTAGPVEQGGEASQPSLTALSSELHRLRCLVIELQNALHRRGADSLIADLRTKYGLPRVADSIRD